MNTARKQLRSKESVESVESVEAVKSISKQLKSRNGAVTAWKQFESNGPEAIQSSQIEAVKTVRVEPNQCGSSAEATQGPSIELVESEQSNLK